jgi:ABC-type nitrate/sulfonate/bicarbonate transport system substrate-binding protein
MIHFQKHLRFAALFLSTLLFIVFTIDGCQQQKTSPPEKVTIAYSTAFNAVLAHIAFAKGYFKEEGLDAVPQSHAFGKLALDAVLDGKADIATAADTPIMFAIMSGKSIKIIAVIQTADRNSGIVSRHDRGIMKPSDFKGKSIGVTRGTTSDFFTAAFLISQGIDTKKVKIIDTRPDEMIAALDTGKVDAVATWNPALTQLQKQLGNKVHTFYVNILYTENFCLAAQREYVKKNPETIKKVLRALIKAETFSRQHPEEARHLVAEFIKADKTILQEIWNSYNFRVILDQALLVDLEDQTRWAINNKLTSRRDMPNYLDYIYMDGLQAVKPEAVRIIR